MMLGFWWVFLLSMSFPLFTKASTSTYEGDEGTQLGVPFTPLYPYDIPKFQSVLRDCRLQCPSTSAVVSKGRFRDFVLPHHFELIRDDNFTQMTHTNSSDTNGLRLLLAMSKNDGRRCELRHNPEWSTTSTWHVAQRFDAHMRIQPSHNQSAFSVMQIHSKQYKGTDGVKYRKGPPLMILHGNDQHLWARVRTNLEPNVKRNQSFDLGPCPPNIFRLLVVIRNSVMLIWINDDLKVTHDFWFLDVLPRNYFKTGPYAMSGDGVQRIEYKELFMGPWQEDDLDSLTPDDIVEHSSETPRDIANIISSTQPTETPTITLALRATSKSTSQRPTEVPTERKGSIESTKESIVSSPSISPTAWPTAFLSSTVKPAASFTDKEFGVLELVLVDADTHQDLLTMTEGQVIDLSLIPSFMIRAETRGVRSVLFALDDTFIRLEHVSSGSQNVSLVDQSMNNLSPWIVQPGTHTISAWPLTKTGDKGILTQPYTLNIQVVESSQTLAPSTMLASTETPRTDASQGDPQIADLVLVDVQTGEDIYTLQNDDKLHKNAFPTGFSIRAEPARGDAIVVRSVVFLVNGVEVQTESFPPFAIAGDARNSNGLKPWNAEPATYKICALPFPEKNGKGKSGDALCLRLNVEP